MITARRLTGLFIAGLLVLGAGLWAVTSQRRAENTEEGGGKVLPALHDALNSVTEVRISKGDGTRATLKKTAADWVVGERDYPADSGRVRKLLLDMADLKVVEPKTSDPASYPQLGVEEVTSPKAGGTLVEVVAPGKTLDLIVGKPSGTQSSFVRPAAAAQSLLASPQLSPDADPRQWLDKNVIDLPEQRVKEVLVQPASGPKYTVTRATAQQTDFSVPEVPKGRELTSAGAANPVASALASLTLDDVRKPPPPGTENGKPAAEATAPGKGQAAAASTAAKAARPPTAGAQNSATKPAQPEVARATFRTFNGLTLQLTGHKDGDRHFILLSAQSSGKDTQSEAQQLNARFASWEVEIPGYKYDEMFRPLEELLKKPEPPPTKKASAHKAAAPSPASATPPSGSTAK